MKSFVTLSDLHAPYEDPDAIALVSAFLTDFHPDEVVFNGDLYDAPMISKYSPRRSEIMKDGTFQSQVDHGQELLSSLIDAASPRETHIILGNHEDRIEQYLGRYPALASLRSLSAESLFGLPGTKFYEYGDGVWLNDSLFLYHGAFHGTTALKKERDRAGASVIIGHGHTQGVEYHTDRSRSYKAMMQGCLCRMKPPYARIPTNWKQGFVMGWVYDDEKFRAVEVEIVRGKDELWMAPLGQRYSTKYGSGKVVTK